MAKRHGAREQKRRAKQKVKRETKRRQLARLTSPDPTIRLRDADAWPIVATLVPEQLWSVGIGSAVIGRRMPSGEVAVGVFLLDVFCLGVKDALWKVVSPAEFTDLCEQFEERESLEPVPPEHFASLVYQAADYGASLGFQPHHDFLHAQRLMAGIDPSQCDLQFEFGMDGKPVYIRGPYETPEQVRYIAQRVKAQGGRYIAPPMEELDSARPRLPSNAGFDDMDEQYDDTDEGYEDMDAEYEEVEAGYDGADADEEADIVEPQANDLRPAWRKWLPWR